MSTPKDARPYVLRAHEVPKEYVELATEAIDAGFTIVRTRGDHLAWRSPNGVDVVHTALTPSDWRAVKNDRARLRRVGLPTKTKRPKNGVC